MKMKISLALTILSFLLLFAGCEMEPTERTGTVEINVSRPERLSGTSESPSRVISRTAQSLVVIAYPSYEDNLPLEIYSFSDSWEAVDAVLANPQAKSLILDLSADDTAQLSGLEPGDWTFIILSYPLVKTEEDLSSSETLDAGSSTSFFIGKNIEIQGGYNHIDAALDPSDYQEVDSSSDPYGYYYGNTSLSPGVSGFFIFTGMTTGEYKIQDGNFGYPAGTEIYFYDDKSRPIPYVYAIDITTESYFWTMNIPAGSESLIIEIYNPDLNLIINVDRSQLGNWPYNILTITDGTV